jgi:acetylornithine deacetylase/succinyl-diaminopimelate desuccinylase-like protein
MRLVGLVLAAFVVLPTVTSAQAQGAAPGEARFREIYRELVEINTVSTTGDTTKAAEAMAARLRAAGFPAADVQVLAPHPKKGNLVARMRGTGARKPLLLLAHLDVVEARPEDWSVDPFKLLEKDGYFYGRGTIDDKAMAAIFVDLLIRFRESGFTPDRDLIVALTADEELGASSRYNGVRWLLANHRPLIEAEFAINEGGGGELRNGRHVLTRVQTTEKVPLSFRLEVTNPGGHSSRPVKDNAIYRLAAGLGRLAQFDFPASLNETTRLYFERTAALWTGPLAGDMRRVASQAGSAEAAARLSADPSYNALLRTTCVPTRLEGGHANNALPQMARAVVNCRILPQEDPAAVQRKLVEVLADPQITVTPTSEPFPGPPSPLRPDVMREVERITSEMWPGVPVMPTMGTGATDSRFLRHAGMPAYGVSGLFVDAADNRTHGKDERIGVRDLFAGREFLFRLVKALSQP